ncbi:MAG: hypothetical protein JJV98_19850, partial [Desulfosarcina sp.]|nr:hypothetical protein [Desulfobacterales bacterium]
MKVASVTGASPPGYDDDAFRQEALEAILQGFKHFRRRHIVDLGRADRGFYMDFYPWRAEDGTLFLSMALYSQFHCKEPIFEKKTAPLTAPWKQRQRLFKKAAALMEAQVADHIKRPASGDAFDPLAADTPLQSWEQIGYPLPPAPPRQKQTATPSVRLTRHWILADSGPEAPPMVQFRFAAPLDNYAGEIKTARGALTLPPSL